MLRLRLGKYFLNRCKERGIVYLPDFICYDMDEIEYQTFWHEINGHPKGQLYTDGIQVIRVSWLRSLFETFKGWLGFENHCQENKVEMTLAKVAYHGYLRGFHPKTFQQVNPPLISERFRSLINAERTNSNSASLQQLLMSYFITHSASIFSLNVPVKHAYPFGQVFIQEQCYQLVPSIDPQESGVISDAIWGMHHNLLDAESMDYFKSSRFADSYADYLVGQYKYKEALQWSELIKLTYKDQYINYYLSQRKTDSQALTYAMELIFLSFSSHEADQAKAIHYIKANYNDTEQLFYTEPYPELRKKVAQSYLSDAKTEKSRYAITKLFIGNKVIPLLAHAVRLVPDILAQDNSMQEIVLREEWFIYLFSEAIRDQRFSEAKALFEAHPDFKFDKNHLMNLRTYYLEEINSKKIAIKASLEQGNCSLAEDTAREVLSIAKKAALITPQDNLIISATIDYAATLLAVDKILQPESKNANLEKLNEAQRLLNCCFMANTPRHKELYNELLLRKIDCLMEQIKVPIDFNDSFTTRTEFVPTIQPQLDLFHQNLNAFITLNEQNKTLAIRQILGKILYLKGDAIHFFTRNKQDAVPYFKKAAEIMPENPYYRLRHYELANDERRHNVRTEIEEIRFLNGSHYDMWSEERWNEERCMSEGFDIHNIPAENRSVLSTITGLFR